MKGLTRLLAAILFLPAMVIGYMIECARPGFDTGREIAAKEIGE